MGLSDVVQSASLRAFAAIADILETVTYTSKPNPGYTPATGTVSNTNTTYPADFLITTYSMREIDGRSILATDYKAMIPCRNLTPVPSTRDTITRSSGAILKVQRITTDPAGAIWELQLRQ